MDVSRLLSNPLFMMGSGLISGNTPSLQPVNPLAGGMRGLGMAGEYQNQLQDNQIRQLLLSAQMSRMQMQSQQDEEKRKKDEAERQAIEAYVSELPPELQNLARANPSAFTAQIARAQFASGGAPKVRERWNGTEAIQEQWNPETKTWTEIGKGPRWAPSGRDAPHVVSVLPEAQYGPRGEVTGYRYLTTYSDGKREYTDSSGVPSQFRTTDPTAQGAAAEASAAGTEKGKFRQTKINTAPLAYQDLDQMTTLAEGLPKMPGFDAQFGTVMGAAPSLRQDTIDAQAQTKRLIGSLTLENRTKLVNQGSISDFESKMLGDSATALSNPRISSAEARKEIGRIKDILANRKLILDQYTRKQPEMPQENIAPPGIPLPPGFKYIGPAN